MGWTFTYDDQSTLAPDRSVTRDQQFDQQVNGGGGGSSQSATWSTGSNATSSWDNSSQSTGSGNGTFAEEIQWSSHIVTRYDATTGEPVKFGWVTQTDVGGGGSGYSGGSSGSGHGVSWGVPDQILVALVAKLRLHRFWRGRSLFAELLRILENGGAVSHISAV